MRSEFFLLDTKGRGGQSMFYGLSGFFLSKLFSNGGGWQDIQGPFSRASGSHQSDPMTWCLLMILNVLGHLSRTWRYVVAFYAAFVKLMCASRTPLFCKHGLFGLFAVNKNKYTKQIIISYSWRRVMESPRSLLYLFCLFSSVLHHF